MDVCHLWRKGTARPHQPQRHLKTLRRARRLCSMANPTLHVHCILGEVHATSSPMHTPNIGRPCLAESPKRSSSPHLQGEKLQASISVCVRTHRWSGNRRGLKVQEQLERLRSRWPSCAPSGRNLQRKKTSQKREHASRRRTDCHGLRGLDTTVPASPGRYPRGAAETMLVFGTA